MGKGAAFSRARVCRLLRCSASERNKGSQRGDRRRFPGADFEACASDSIRLRLFPPSEPLLMPRFQNASTAQSFMSSLDASNAGHPDAQTRSVFCLDFLFGMTFEVLFIKRTTDTGYPVTGGDGRKRERAWKSPERKSGNGVLPGPQQDAHPGSF